MELQHRVVNLTEEKVTTLSNQLTPPSDKSEGNFIILEVIMTKNISDYLFAQHNPKHNQIDFLNITTVRDVKLFIDPVLIEIGESNFCKCAKAKTSDFFHELYMAYYKTNDSDRKKYLLKHAREINDAHLGYAKKYGHGNTEDGLYEIFKGIDNYITSINLTCFFELALYIPNFAEDSMSDLLINILYKELSEFTIEQCKKYNFETKKCNKDRFYWNGETHSWDKYTGESMIIDDKIYLLIPKEIVQTHYRFTADNFLRSVIVENICEEAAFIDKKGKKYRPAKDKIRESLIEENGTIFETIKKFSKQNNMLLKQYQSIVNNKYKTLRLGNDELDSIIYKNFN